jgi:hypothetical protein
MYSEALQLLKSDHLWNDTAIQTQKNKEMDSNFPSPIQNQSVGYTKY